jgi:hypothetical protein
MKDDTGVFHANGAFKNDQNAINNGAFKVTKCYKQWRI